MPRREIIAEQCSFSPSALIELWTLDGTAIGLDTIYYFVNASNSSYQAVVFNSISYAPFPIIGEGFGYDGKGQNVRPRITVSNINGFTSNLLLQYGQLNGATVTRQRVFARFLDASNFPTPRPVWVTPDSTAAYAPEPFIINRKVTENQQIVQFELIPPIDLQNARLPFRQIIANVCRWKYRGHGCQYSGAPIADIANRSFTGSIYNMTLVDRGAYSASTTYARGDYTFVVSDLPAFSGIRFYYVCTTNGTVGVTPSGTSSRWISDSCSHNCAGCKLRYPTVPLRGSFFPGVARSPWISRA